MQYRVASSGPFAGVPGGYVADATGRRRGRLGRQGRWSGPGQATKLTRPARARCRRPRTAATGSGARAHDERGRTGRVGRDRRHRGLGGRRRERLLRTAGAGPGSEAAGEHAARTHRLGANSCHLHAREARSGGRAPWARRNRVALPPITRGAGAIRSGPRRRRTEDFAPKPDSDRFAPRASEERAPSIGGRFRARGRRGVNRVRFSGRVRARPLAPGAYFLQAGGRPRRAEIRGDRGPLPDRRRGLTAGPAEADSESDQIRRRCVRASGGTAFRAVVGSEGSELAHVGAAWREGHAADSRRSGASAFRRSTRRRSAASGTRTAPRAGAGDRRPDRAESSARSTSASERG